MVRLLLVANKTLASGEVSSFVLDRVAKEKDCQFTLLVPATPRDHGAGARLVHGMAGVSEARWQPRNGVDPGSAESDWEAARSRLDFGLDTLRKLGAHVDGEVGDANPAKAIAEVLQHRQYDEVVLSTLPKGVSRWLGLDIPHQIRRRFHLPVTVISVQSVPRHGESVTASPETALTGDVRRSSEVPDHQGSPSASQN
jgi:hypothetical protein